MDILKQLNYKKTRQQLKYLQIELEETKFIYAKSLDKFNAEFNDQLDNSNINKQEPESSTASSFESLQSEVDNEILKETYKKIATKVHPDKVSGDEEKFKILNTANKNKDYGAMLELADELDLMDTIPSDAYSNTQMKLQINAVIEMVKKLQNTIAWQWYHLEDNQRDVYREHILNQLQ